MHIELFVCVLWLVNVEAAVTQYVVHALQHQHSLSLGTTIYLEIWVSLDMLCGNMVSLDLRLLVCCHIKSLYLIVKALHMKESWCLE
jgi:hypothetical protein